MSASSKARETAPARAVSGFPEYLPQHRRIEQRWLDTIRAEFESFGYTSIETRSVEEVESITAKGGDVDKEIYSLRRLAARAEHRSDDAPLCLHFDLTVPFARYVAQHAGALSFPFKRYQIQKAWRGERPQEGRFREFTQCDIDVIDENTVSMRFDIEVPAIMAKVLDRLEIGPVELRLNNRKILQGFYEGLGIDDTVAAIRIMDRLDKIGTAAVQQQLMEVLNVSSRTADLCVRLAAIRTSDGSFESNIQSLGVENPTLREGVLELQQVMHGVLSARTERCTPIVDLSVARGLDYYTGSVYEVSFSDFPGYPTICGGGRYDNLAGLFTKRKLGGVGVSIGLTRIFTKLLKEGRLNNERPTPTHVLVAALPGSSFADLDLLAARLRSRRINVEVYHQHAKLDKQFKYAEKKGIPYVWFVNGDVGVRAHEVKNMSSGIQVDANPDLWQPSPQSVLV